MKKIIFLLVVALSSFVLAQDKPAPPPEKPAETKSLALDPTADQTNSLEVARLKASVAHERWEKASDKLPEHFTFNEAVSAVEKTCQSVISANKWPSSVRCLMQDLDSPITFVDAGKRADAPKPEPVHPVAPPVEVKK